jgi:guanylate kinase
VAHQPTCFVVSGPSGSGKTTLVKHLLDRYSDLLFSVSYTTRQPRLSEQNGREYHFVGREDFEARIARGEFLEYARVFDDYYGTHRRYLEQAEAQHKDLVLDIDVQGARQVRERSLNAVFIFVLPPSCEALKQRLRARGLDTAEAIERRLEFARREIEQIDRYDYVVVNEERTQACRSLEAILEVERARRQQRPVSPTFEERAGACYPDVQRERLSAILESFRVHIQ